MSRPTDRNAEAAVRTLLAYVGEDPTRDGLLRTPDRVRRALLEMTAGTREDPLEPLRTVFAEPCDEMVVLRGIEFSSLCEHHLLPFRGTACVGYLPADRVVGLSKLARVVQAFARRLQVQERMTQDIARAVNDGLGPLGVGVLIEARHSCMSARGARSPGRMITSCLLGKFRESPEARAEFLALARGA